jgi:hypothetical protein
LPQAGCNFRSRRAVEAAAKGMQRVHSRDCSTRRLRSLRGGAS